MAKAPAQADPALKEFEDEAPAPRRGGFGKRAVLIGLLVIVLGGVGAWLFFTRQGPDEAHAQAQVTKRLPPVFVPLDTFTVNLNADEGEQYLQLAATLRVLDDATANAVKQYMPEIRHRLLTLLASKKAAQITSSEGRERLAEEMRQTLNNVLLNATGKPQRPIVLDVPRDEEAGDEASEPAAAQALDATGDAQALPDEAPAHAAESEPERMASSEPAQAVDPDGATTPDAATSAVPGADDAAAQPDAARPAAPAARPATRLARAAADDPVQGVFFTSFIVQ